MGLLTDVNQNVDIDVPGSTVVIRKTKKGALIVCPLCRGIGRTSELDPNYGYEMQGECPRCHGGGCIEVTLHDKK